MSTDNQKQCSKCGQWLELRDFHKSSKSKRNARSQCKQCKKISDGIYYQKNKEKIKERSRKYYHEHKITQKEKNFLIMLNMGMVKLDLTSEAGKVKYS